jgi:hypothetical protein
MSERAVSAGLSGLSCCSWLVLRVRFRGWGQRQLARGLRLHQPTDRSGSPVPPGHMHIGWSQQQQPETALCQHCSACCVGRSTCQAHPTATQEGTFDAPVWLAPPCNHRPICNQQVDLRQPARGCPRVVCQPRPVHRRHPGQWGVKHCTHRPGLPGPVQLCQRLPGLDLLWQGWRLWHRLQGLPRKEWAG